MSVRYEWVTATHARPEIADADNAEEDYGIDELIEEGDLVLVLDSESDGVAIEGTRDELLAFLDSARSKVVAYRQTPVDDDMDEDTDED